MNNNQTPDPMQPEYRPEYSPNPGAPLQGGTFGAGVGGGIGNGNGKKNSGLAVTSMVFGILAIVSCGCCTGIAFGVAAVIIAFVDRGRVGRMSGMAVAGLVCGLIGLALSVGSTAFAIVYSDQIAAMYEDMFNEFTAVAP